MSSGPRQWTAAVASVVGIAIAAAVSGCVSEAENANESVPQISQTAPAAKLDVSLSVTDAAGLQDLLAKHRGKVVLIDYWATWCAPCVEQFPHTVELAVKFRSRGLAVVSVSMDNPSAEPQVRAFLEQHEARFDNLLNSYSSPVTATKAFGLPGPVPCYQVYDREGRLHREFGVDPRAAKQFTTTDIDAAVEELL